MRPSERWIRTPVGFHFSRQVAGICAVFFGLSLAVLQDHHR